MALINLEFAKTMTGITDDTIMQFYLDAAISKIEKIIGYSLSSTEQKDYIDGKGISTHYSDLDLNGYYIWLPRKPVTAISEVKIRDEVIDSDNYTLRNASNVPHIVLSENHLCYWEEAEITYTAGFVDEALDKDIEMFIFSLINDFQNTLEDGELKSYKIRDVAYQYTTYLEKQSKLYDGISELFGLI